MPLHKQEELRRRLVPFKFDVAIADLAKSLDLFDEIITGDSDRLVSVSATDTRSLGAG